MDQEFQVGDYVKFSRQSLGDNGVRSFDDEPWIIFAMDCVEKGIIFAISTIHHGDEYISIEPVIADKRLEKRFIDESFRWVPVWFEKASVLDIACVKTREARKCKKKKK